MKKVLLFDLDQTILNRNESLLKFLNWQVSYLNLVPHVIYAELSGDFPLGDSRQPIYKSLRPFDLVS